MKCDLCPSNESSEYFLKTFIFKSSIAISICDSCMKIFFNNFKIFKKDMEMSGLEYYKKNYKDMYIFKNHYDQGQKLSERVYTDLSFDDFIDHRATGISTDSCILFDKQTKELSSWIKELINDFGNEGVISYIKKREAKEIAKEKKEWDELIKRTEKAIKKEKKQKAKIVSFLKKEGKKLPASDIDFQLRIGDVDLVKELCEEMYWAKKIRRTGNYRYFVNQSKNQSKISSNKSGKNIDIKAELEKLKILFDEGLITKKQYEAKSNKLLGI